MADRRRAVGVSIELDDLIRDLDSLQQATIEKDGKRIATRTDVEVPSPCSAYPPGADATGLLCRKQNQQDQQDH